MEELYELLQDEFGSYEVVSERTQEGLFFPGTYIYSSLKIKDYDLLISYHTGNKTFVVTDEKYELYQSSSNAKDIVQVIKNYLEGKVNNARRKN